jgi:hypothetical protein
VEDPAANAIGSLSDLATHNEINFTTPYMSQHITFNNANVSIVDGYGEYTCDFALTVVSTQSAPLATVTERSGIVEISRAQESTWKNVMVGTVLKNGDWVRTGSNGQAKIGFKDGSYLILGSDSSFTVAGVGDPTFWNLMRGKYYFVVHLLQQWILKKFEVRTPNVAVAIRGTEFTVEVAGDNATTVTILKGTVDVQDRTSGSNATITANQTLTLPNVPGGLTPQEMSALITEVNSSSVNRWWETSTLTYSLTIESSTGGSTDPPVETYTQDAGTTLAVTANPDSGYTLAQWLLDGANAGNSNPITVTFTSNHTLQPVFTQGGTAQYTLTIQTQLSGSQNAIPISLSESDTFQLSVTPLSENDIQWGVAAGKINGTGSGQGTISVSPSWTSPISVPFTNTYNVTGTVDKNGNASLDIAEVTTNAPLLINITSQPTQQTNITPQQQLIYVGTLTRTDNSRSYGILLQNGYQETVPFPSYYQIQGQAVITVGGTGPSTRTAGVNPGDWAQYNVSMGTYNGTIPSGFVEVQSGNLSVTGVSGSNVALNILGQYKNGTSSTMTFQLDVNTGEATSGPNFFLIAAGLGAGEDENNFKMNGTSTWQYNGQNRPTPYSNSTIGDYIWDQTTGLLIYAKLPQYQEDSTTLNATMTFQLVDTNAFSAITQYTLTIQSSTGGSTIPTGTFTKNAGTTLTVTATPNSSYTFDHWLLDGANAGNNNPITVTFNSAHTLQPVFTQGQLNRVVGVNQNDWAQYSVSWQAGTPSPFSSVTGIKVTVAAVSGTTLTISTTMQLTNGTTMPSSPFTIDVNTGQGGTTTSLNTAVIASGLNQGDLVFTSPQSSLPNAQITDVTTWTQNGFNRTAVHFKSNTLGEYCWDRDTGILLYAEVSVNLGTSSTTATLMLTGTNRFSGGSAPGGLPTSILPLVAVAAAVVIALILAAIVLRRHHRKPHAQPAETVKPEAPEKTVEPEAKPVEPQKTVEARATKLINTSEPISAYQVRDSNMESHKIVGYALLVIGLIVVIMPPYFGVSILFRGASAIPKILETPVLSDSTTTSNGTVISTSSLNSIITAIFPAVNVVLLLLLSLILIYAGGVIMGKGVSLIKEIKLRAVREAVKEASEEIEVKKEKANEPIQREEPIVSKQQEQTKKKHFWQRK